MGQVTIYLPKQIEDMIKKETKKSHKSVSAYISEILSKQLSPRKWSDKFLKVCGTWEGDFPDVEELKNNSREEWE